ncbi:MAG TPA: hypothetical protein VMD09_12770 [Solirubrobacteraceae bacterium]|nr:hypothetical protein [Solirubrobacteraceae bacterium]
MDQDLQELTEKPLRELTEAELRRLGGSRAAAELDRRLNSAFAATATAAEPDDAARARTAAARRGLLRSDIRLAAGGFGDLDREADRIRRDAPRRMAVIEAERRRQAEQRRRHAELAAIQQPEQVLADRGYGVASPGWQPLVKRAAEALASDARRDQRAHDPRVQSSIDPDDIEHENRLLGTPDARRV